MDSSGTSCKGRDTIIVSVGTAAPPTITDSSRCGPGQVKLVASGVGEFKWWDQSTGGTLLARGDTFTTPSLNNDSVYYVNASFVNRDAIQFDGNDDYVAINDSYTQKGEIDELTVEAWVKTSVNSGGQTDNWAIVDFDRSDYYNFFVHGDGRLAFSTADTNGTVDDFYGPSGDAVNDGNWHHVAAVYDGTDKKLYVDGSLIATNLNAHSGSPLGTGSTRFGFMGDGSEATSFDGTRNNAYFNGSLDEVRVWDTSKTATQITNYKDSCLNGNENRLSIYYRMDNASGNTLTDISGGNDGTLNNNPTWTTNGPAINCSSCGESNRIAATATIHDTVHGSAYVASCPGENGTNVELSANGGSGQYDYREMNGIFNYSGSFSGPPTNKILPNGGSFEVEVKDQYECKDTVSGISTEPTPSNIPTNDKVGACIVPGTNNWFYILDNNNKIIASINDQGTNLNNVTTEVYVDGTVNTYNGRAYLQRHFVIQTVNPPANGTRVRLYFTNTELNNYMAAAAATDSIEDDISSVYDLGVTKFDDDPSGTNEDDVYDPSQGTVNFLTPSAFGTEFNNNYIEVTVNSFSEFWIHGNNSFNSPLPVELTRFDVSQRKNEVKVSWVTASETNSDRFLVERSPNGKDFERIGSRQASGNSNSRKEYTLLDPHPLSGLSYYRLVQMDNDGKKMLFGPKSVRYNSPDAPPEWKVYPNPAENQVFVHITNGPRNEKVQLKLSDLLGRERMNRKVATDPSGNAIISLTSLDKIPAGVYLVTLQLPSGKTLNERLIIQR